jgi:hypothetical protein
MKGGLIVVILLLFTFLPQTVTGSEAVSVYLNFIPYPNTIPLNSTNYFIVNYTLNGIPRTLHYFTPTAILADPGSLINVSGASSMSVNEYDHYGGEAWIFIRTGGEYKLGQSFSLTAEPANYTIYYYDLLGTPMLMNFTWLPNGDWPELYGSFNLSMDFPVLWESSPTVNYSTRPCGYSDGDLYPNPGPLPYYWPIRNTLIYFPNQIYYNKTHVVQAMGQTVYNATKSRTIVVNYDLVKGKYQPHFLNAPNKTSVVVGTTIPITARIFDGLLWSVESPFPYKVISPAELGECPKTIVRSWLIKITPNKPGTYPINVTAMGPVAETKTVTLTVDPRPNQSLTLYSTPGGSVSPGNSTYPYGSNVTIKAAASQNYTFIRWIGYGTGSYSGPNNPASVTMNSNITEIAIFQPRPIVQTVYVNQTVTKYVNQTVYVPEYINRTVYVNQTVPEYINRTVNIPFIPWWVWLILVVAVVEAFIIIGLSLREGRKEKREEEKKEKASSFSDF